MEYVDILSMVMDSDSKTTKEFESLFHGVNTQYFVDSKLLSDEPITNATKDGRFISVYIEDDIIHLEYMFDGTGSLKSCTKKVEFQFSTSVEDELIYLDANTLTSADTDLDQYIWCMEATVFNLVRDSVDFNQISQKEKYSISYHLRKNKNEHFFLESKLWLSKPYKLNNKYIANELSVFSDIKPTFQRIIRKNDNISLNEQLAELEEINEFFGDVDFDDFDDEIIDDADFSL